MLKAFIDSEAHAAATSPHNLRRQPTAPQREAGNYKLGHCRIGPLRISIENPAGSKRRPEWPTMQAHYGYVRGTEGADGDHVDVFIRPGTPEDWVGTVYVIDQTDESGAFDEVKAMIGWSDQRTAEQAYLAHYTRGWKLGPVTAVGMADFARWCRSDATQYSFSDWGPVPTAASFSEPKPEVAAWSRKLASMVAKAFDPDQPRDENGRFVLTGGVDRLAKEGAAAPAAAGWVASSSATSGITAYGKAPRQPKRRKARNLSSLLAPLCVQVM